MNIGWPEGIWIGLVIINLIIKATLDGKPLEGKHSLSNALLNLVLTFGLLYWGGFFE